MKIGVAIILYNPELNSISKIFEYTPEFDEIYFFDNTEINTKNFDFIKEHEPRSKYITFQKNLGIAKSLNFLAKKAIEDKLDALVTMDQDSNWNLNYLKSYLSCIKGFSFFNKVALFGVNIGKPPIQINTDCAPYETNITITSGSCINLGLFNNLSGFDENLFIDGVDTDYCHKAQINDLKIIVFPNVFMNHSIGNVINFNLGLFKLTKYIHPPIRLYYMVRNHLYLNNKYKLHPGINRKYHSWSVSKKIFSNLVYNPKRFQVFKYLVKALIDYKKEKFGQISNS